MPKGATILQCTCCIPAGKQSLARLAAFICGYEVFQIAVTSTYGTSEFRAVSGKFSSSGRVLVCCTLVLLCHATLGGLASCLYVALSTFDLQDLLSLYQKAGAKGIPVVLLMTDNQIVKENFLVYINDLLANGDIPDLCSLEDRENFINAVRSGGFTRLVRQGKATLFTVQLPINLATVQPCFSVLQVRHEVKASGLVDTPGNCWQFFIERVRKNLHVVLCFSPVGDSFRVRARQFPALVNCTVFNW